MLCFVWAMAFCPGNRLSYAGANFAYWRWFVLGCHDVSASCTAETYPRCTAATGCDTLQAGLTACNLFYRHRCCIDLLWHHPGISCWNTLERSSKAFHFPMFPCNMPKL